jgi:hypothetical protein
MTDTEITTITLSSPIKRGETEITELGLRKPKAGELRGGLTLQSLITTDIAAILTLIPRISNPPLAPHEVEELDPADLTEIGGTIRGFFMTAAERMMMEAMMAPPQSKH